MVGVGADRVPDGGGGGADGLVEQGGGEAGAGGLVGVAGGVEADDGVVVDDAAGLGLGDLDEPDRGLAAELALGESGVAGEVARQVSEKPFPQVPGVGVEQHGGGVVVAVGAQGPAQ